MICRQFVILAEQSDTRSIAVCEHATVHLIWDVVTIRLHRDTLLRLATFLTRWALQPDQSVTQEQAFQLFASSDGSVHLWIAQAGLYLSATDALLFATLVCDATEMLASAAAPESPVSAAYCPMQVEEPHGFAGN